MTEQQTTPAGWYPHPSMTGTLGYWNGERWTENVAPMGGGVVPAKAAPQDINGALLVLGYLLAVMFPIGGLIVAAAIWRQSETHAGSMIAISFVSGFIWFSLLNG